MGRGWLIVLGLSLTAYGADGPATQPSDQLSPQARSILAQMRYGDSPQVAAIIDPSASGDPIGPLADKMEDVVTDLSAIKTDHPVQAKQKQVVSDLDGLIAELEKQQSGNGGGNPNPTTPMARSVLAKGPGGSGPLHDPQAGSRLWGQLPAKEREQILQSQTEGFPPGFESVLAGYFSHLAQGQTSVESGAATQPAGK